MILSYKYRIYPNKTQARELGYLRYLARGIYNDCIAINKRRWEQSRQTYSRYDMRDFWTGQKGIALRNDPAYPELRLLSSATIDAIIHRLYKAYAAFWRRYGEFSRGERTLPAPRERDGELSFKARCWKAAGFPRFKNRQTFGGLEFPSGFKVVEEKMRVGLRLFQVSGTVKVRYHRALPEGATIKNVVVTEDKVGKWWACLQIQFQERPLPAGMLNGAVGIDLGIATTLALSDGRAYDHDHRYRESLRQRRILQRKLDRQRRANNPGNFNADGTAKKGAGNWKYSTRMKETERRLKQMDATITKQRWYFWHVATDELTRRYSYIALEDLTLDFLIKNKRLAMSAHDAAFGTFWERLEEKAQERGAHIVKVDPRHTSQICAVCGCVDKENRKTQAVFRCVECGHEENADLNAARNILRRALGQEEFRQEAGQVAFWRE